jgi:hypothetical protein
MNTHSLTWLRLLAAATLGGLVLPAAAQIDPAATTVLKATSAKLGAARTLRVQARHTLDPALGLGFQVEKAAFDVTVARPNKFHALQSGDVVRELAYDGRTFCLIDPKMKLHAQETVKAGSIEGFADQIDARFGFRPPLAELLATDMQRELLLHVTTARVVGRERVGWTACHRVQLVQEGMTTDLWVGVKDSLPRRLRMTFTRLTGAPMWDIRFSEWELDPALTAARTQLFSKRPGPDSQRLTLVRRN